MNIRNRRRIRELPLFVQPGYRLSWNGVEHLSTAELLALVLQAGDGMDLAADLLTHFGSLEAVRKATLAELETVAGIGPTRAAAITSALELGRRLCQPLPEQPQVRSPQDAMDLLQEMGWLEQEELRVLLLDTKCRVQRMVTVYVGNVGCAVIRIAELFREAIRDQSVAVILAHNHPSGDPTPSPEDVNVTRRIIEAGKLLDIEVLDHLVISRERWVSLKERGLLNM